MNYESIEEELAESYSREEKLEKEIERLNKMLEEKFMKENPFLVENGVICMKNKEIERLNNIINELEKDMNRDDLSYVETQYVLDKIKELKGSDK